LAVNPNVDIDLEEKKKLQRHAPSPPPTAPISASSQVLAPTKTRLSHYRRVNRRLSQQVERSQDERVAHRQ